MNPPAWPDDTDHLWAKSAVKGQAAGQSLAAHTWETLLRLRELARLRPDLPRLVDEPMLWSILFRAALIHDWGKIATGFQKTLRGGPRWPFRHEVLSLAFADWVTGGWTQSDKVWLTLTVASHHKDLAQILDSYLPEEDDPEDDPLRAIMGQVRRADAARLWRWLAQCIPAWDRALEVEALGVQPLRPPPAEEAVTQLLAGGSERIRDHLLTMEDHYYELEDSIWDDEENGLESPAIFQGILLRGGMIQADHLASSGSGPLPDPRLGPAERLLDAVGVSQTQLYAHQRDAQRPGHLLLSAPTGSGKTEAALLWAIRQDAPRLFYTLPYQASMNAMYDRLRHIYPRRVGLLHGRSALSLYQRFMDQEYTPAEATRLAKGERNLAGLPYYPLRVFSPYQMLKAVFQLKGYEAMLTDFAQGAFVFDEIHAYEPARLAMILETVQLLARRFGARFLIMSATLPAPVRERLDQALHPLARVRAEPSLYTRFRRHRLHLAAGDLLEPAHLTRIAGRYEAGEQVLVVCNTVARAQAAWSWFRERLPAGGALSLIHGRFNGRDRGRKEQQILARTGVHQTGTGTGTGTATRGPALVVATQVVEVSLNLDLDALYTDPAPLDALWQRFGRVNRLGRRALAPVTVFRQPDDGQHIYDPILVQNTLALLEDATLAGPRPVDEALAQDWLDLVYSGAALEAWTAKYEEAAREFQDEFLTKLIPFQAQPGLSDAFGKLFDGLEVLPESLYDEYQALKTSDRALEASQLLVPLGWGHYQMLRGKGLVVAGEKGEPPVVQVGYDGEVGLRLKVEG